MTLITLDDLKGPLGAFGKVLQFIVDDLHKVDTTLCN